MLLSTLTAWGCARAPERAEAATTLTILTHWGAGYQEKLEPYFREYERLHPGIRIVHYNVPFAELLRTVLTSQLAGRPPDIYHLYSLWAVELAARDLLAQAPADVAAAVRTEYPAGAVAGATVAGRLHGYPTEVAPYALVYDRVALAEAGIDRPPATYEELLETARRVTRHGPEGRVERAGFGIARGAATDVVLPFQAMVAAYGTRLVDERGATSFTGPGALKATELQRRLFAEGIASPATTLRSFGSEFVSGRIAMAFVTPDWEGALKLGMGERYARMATAPLPAGPYGRFTSHYTWFWAVGAESPRRAQAWRFLDWLNRAVRAEGPGSRMGEFLVGLGVIPARRADQAAFPAELDDPFTRPYVASLAFSLAEPNVAGGQELKDVLMQELEAAWLGHKRPAGALAAASRRAALIAEDR